MYDSGEKGLLKDGEEPGTPRGGASAKAGVQERVFERVRGSLDEALDDAEGSGAPPPVMMLGGVICVVAENAVFARWRGWEEDGAIGGRWRWLGADWA